MDLDRIDIKTRTRNPWEAIDLGFIMASKWFRPLFLSWFIPAAILYVLLRMFFTHEVWLALFVVWWLKPLLDRGPLYIASHRLFDDDISVLDTMRHLPRLYSKDIIAWLTWRRFSVTRSFDMPVTVLESLKHKARSARLIVLHSEVSSAAFWLTVVCAHLELVIVIGLIGLVAIMIPDGVDIGFLDLIREYGIKSLGIYDMLTMVSMALVAPFYTMAGFSLYINRRIKLEAWDIEIRFRHIAERMARKNILSIAASVLLIVVSASILVMPQKSYAEDNYVKTRQESRTVIKKILAGSDFHQKELKSGWRLKKISDTEKDESIPDWLISVVRFLEWLFGSADTPAKEHAHIDFAAIVKAVLWLSAIALALYVLYRLYANRELFRFGKSKQGREMPPPEMLFGLDVRETSIPDDLISQTLALWSKGQHREAVGLLYRSTLSVLMHRYSYRFKQGDTEQECAEKVRQNDSFHLDRVRAPSATCRTMPSTASAKPSTSPVWTRFCPSAGP